MERLGVSRAIRSRLRGLEGLGSGDCCNFRGSGFSVLSTVLYDKRLHGCFACAG